jgi:lipopolysaccharide biosynthesis glycosyltransferase
MKNVIIAGSDRNCEQFLVNHWLKSLIDNVNLENTDIIVLDYGISKESQESLRQQGVIVHSFIKDGVVPTVRFLDTLKILLKTSYDQVMTCDGGDLIFQKDISCLFNQDKDAFRAACEGVPQPVGLYLIGSMRRKDALMVKEATRKKRIINSGFLIAPRTKFIKLLEETQTLIKRNWWGVEQPIFNYIFYRDGYTELPCTYNFTLGNPCAKYNLKDGKFYFEDGELISVVHNTGGWSWYRLITDFGYGSGLNHQNALRFHTIRSMHKVTNIFYDILNF